MTQDKKEPKKCMTDGTPVDLEALNTIDPETNQQMGHVALCPAERAKGFIRPVRYKYVHNTCGGVTTMGGNALAETYAREPKFYGRTFCAHCGDYFPVGEFVWDGTDEVVGS